MDKQRESEVIICRCEEITEVEIRRAVQEGRSSVGAVKKATRAGMGACQGRTCSQLVEKILKSEGIAEPEPDKSRFPIVPCPASTFVDSSFDEKLKGDKIDG